MILTVLAMYFSSHAGVVNAVPSHAPLAYHDRSAIEESTASSLLSSAQSSNLDCTLVELFPGYPKYRGNITGVMPHWNGLGDYECLHILEQEFPQLDRAREDRANQQAADALGVNGPMNLWTWENWMLIEAERGMVPSCYTCLMLDTSTMPLRANVYPDPDDYRILTGLFGQTTSLTAIASAIGHNSPMGTDQILRFYDYDDYVLRAVAYLMGEPTLNARELYTQMQGWADAPFRDAGPVGDIFSIDPRKVLSMALWERGGYTVVPDNAAPSDQTTMMAFPIAISAKYWPSSSAESMWALFDETVRRWLASGPSIPLDSFMQQDSRWQTYL